MNFDAPGEISVGDNNLFELTGNLLADARAELTKEMCIRDRPMSEHRTFKYFKEETLQKYAKQYGWTLIDLSLIHI